MNHPLNLGSIWQGEDLIESFESETPDSLPLAVGSSDHAPDPFNLNRMFDLFCHGTFWFSCGFSSLFSETSPGVFSWWIA
jgi:hypothetical protein